MTIQTDPFSSVRLKSKQSNQTPIQNKNEEKVVEDPFSSVRIKKAEGFPALYETGRHAARIGSRIAETIGGLPGDVGSLIQSGVLSGLEKLVGYKLPEEAKQESRKYRSPTSSELKKLSEESTKGFTKAQSPEEEIGDEIAQTAASLLGPMKFRSALGIAIGSQSAKEGLKILGLGQGSQEAGKLGTMFLLSTINPGGALKYASSQYQKANALSKGASINAPNFQGNLENLVQDLKKGVTTTSKNAVLKPAEELINKVKGGKILVHDLTAAKRDLNTLIKDPEVLKREKKLLKVIGKEIDNAIKPYERINPAFKEAYRPANEIYGAVMQGTKASDFIKKNLGPKSILASLLAESALGHPEAILPTLGAAGVLYSGTKSAEFFVRMAKSKELQKFYSKALMAAAEEDVSALRLYEEKINDFIEKN